MAFKEQVTSVVHEILSDPLNLPAQLLDYIPQFVAQNPVPLARTSGDRIAYDTNTSPVTTTGTTFAGGADLLVAPLTFLADGKTTYIVRVSATSWSLSVANANLHARLNLDSADAGFVRITRGSALAGGLVVMMGAAAFTPAAGSHTVNVRVNASAAATVTVDAGAGGAATSMPILVTLEIA